MKIAISVLQDFSYQRPSKQEQQFYAKGTVFYVDIENPEEKNELLFLLSNGFPYRNRISIEFSEALLRILSISEIQELDEFPENAAGRRIIFWHSGLKKLYIHVGNTWLDITRGTSIAGESLTVIPPLFGEVISNGLTNETQIAPGVIKNVHIAPDARIELSKLEADPRNRATHTGTQLAATISDFKPAVRLVRLDEMAAPATAVTIANQRVIDVSNPINAKDAVNKQHLEAVIDDLALSDLNVPEANISMANFGIKYLADPTEDQDAINKRTLDRMLTAGAFKQPVRVVDTSTTSYPRSGSANIDGVSVVAGQRVLRASTTSLAKNGIWEVQSGTWVRAKDASVSEQYVSGMEVNVQEGTLGANSKWMLTSPDGPVVLETSQLVFSRKDGALGLALGEGLDTVGNTIEVVYNPSELQVGVQGLEISDSFIGKTSINTVGTITTGQWEGSPVDVAYGGTGGTTAEEARINLQAADLIAGTSLGIQALPNLSQAITLAQGGTGLNAASGKEVLDAFGGVGSARTVAAGFSILSSVIAPTLSDSKVIGLKALVAGTGVVIADNGTTLTVSASQAQADINTQLTGYPLNLDKGGTGVNATNPAQALNALGGLTTVTVSGTGETLLSTVSGGTGSTAKQAVLKGLTAGTGITFTPSTNAIGIAVNKAALAFNINTELVGYPLSLANGGTGIAAANGAQALNALGGLASVTSTGAGETLLGATTGGTGSTAKSTLVKSIEAGFAISLLGSTDKITLGVNKAALALNINTELVGYPLNLTNGGTGGSYASLGHLLAAQSGVFSVASTSAPTGAQVELVGTTTNNVAQGKTCTVKKVVAGAGITVTGDADKVTIASTLAESPVKFYNSAVLATASVSAPYLITVNHNLFSSAGAEFDAQVYFVLDSTNAPVVADLGASFTQTSTTLAFSADPGPVKVNIIANDV
jgi:hypothetical protein